jgi:hypothetical protein
MSPSWWSFEEAAEAILEELGEQLESEGYDG